MVPSIFCCQTCVCKDNDFDISFDLDGDSDNETGEKKHLLNKKNKNTENKTLYFYFKEKTSLNDIENIIECIKYLPIGVIDNITVITSKQYLSYIKIKYLKLNKQFVSFYKSSITNELIVGININKNSNEHHILPKPLQGTQLSNTLGHIVYSIDYCCPTEIVLWMSHNKKLCKPIKENIIIL